MRKASGRLIVDLGCGGFPVFVDLEKEARSKKSLLITTSISKDLLSVRKGDRYIGIDQREDLVDLCKKFVKRKRWSCFDTPRISFQVGDATELKIASGSVDVVLLSDVLSAPTPGTTPVSEPYPDEDCITEKTKWAIIMEALRVLRDDGHLVIQIQLTPCYARIAMNQIKRILLNKGQIKLVRQCGKFVDDSDNWHLYQGVFQKAAGPFKGTAEVIPWTTAQKKHIEEYAGSWDCWC